MRIFVPFRRLMLAGLCLGLALPGWAAATAFTYQGKLASDGAPAAGSYDFRCALYDAPTNGTLVAGPLTNSAVAVTNGVFLASLDFGAGAFTGADRWLEIGVRTNGAGAFSTLAPRQPLTPAPTALYAAAAATAASYAGSVSSAQLAGVIPLALLPSGLLTNNAAGVTLAGSFQGSAAGLTNAPWSNSRSGLLAAAAAGQYQVLNLLSDPNGIPTNATVLWPDGSYGVWTATNINAAWFAVDGYTLTYTNTGATIAQPAMRRDQNGLVTNAPPLVIAP